MDSQRSENQIKRILVGVDGSEPSIAALKWARELAITTSARLDVLCAWQTPFPSIELIAIGMNLELSELNERPLHIAEYRIEKSIFEAFGESKPVNINRLVEEGNPGLLLVEASKDYDLLVLGNRGHTPIVETLLGSVSQHCLSHSHCPVVIVK